MVILCKQWIPLAVSPPTKTLGYGANVSPQVQRDCADLLSPYFTADGLVARCLQYAQGQDHIMDFTRLRALSSLFSMLNQMVRNILSYNQFHPDFPLQVGPSFSLSCRLT